MAIAVVILSLNISYLVVLFKYSKSAEFESYSDSFLNREQQIMWKVLPIVISVINVIAIIFAGVTNTSRMIAALMFLMLAGRPFIRAIVWANSPRRMWMTFVLKEEIPIAMSALICILLVDYMIFTRIAGPLFG